MVKGIQQAKKCPIMEKSHSQKFCGVSPQPSRVWHGLSCASKKEEIPVTSSPHHEKEYNRSHSWSFSLSRASLKDWSLLLVTQTSGRGQRPSSVLRPGKAMKRKQWAQLMNAPGGQQPCRPWDEIASGDMQQTVWGSEAPLQGSEKFGKLMYLIATVNIKVLKSTHRSR